MTTKILRSLRVLSVAFAVLFGLTLSTLAQSSGNGSIAGVVTDPSGATVAGATVIVTNTDTGIKRTLTTNGAGIYNATFLLPGHYNVRSTAPSFGTVVRKDVLLTVGETLAIDASLPPASVASAVEVTADTPILDPAKIEVSQTFDPVLLANLPVASRNWSAFVLNTPNVVQDGGTGLVSFHGISGLYNQNYVDGSNNNQMLFSEARGRSSGAPYVYSIDSIKEFQAETSNYSVEFGQAAGGQVNAITKNGTNQIHGDLFYYLRYPDLNALDPYNKYIAKFNPPTAAAGAFLLTQPTHQQNQFGGSVGGPIIKDRLFYFFTYDGFRKVGRVLYSDTNTITTTSPAGTTYTTNNTASPAQCPVIGTAGYTQTFGITATQCLNAITFLQGVSTAAPGRFQHQNLFFPRLDYHINAKNDLFVDYNFVDYDSTYGYSPANTFSNSSPSTNAPTSYHERFLVAGLTTQIGKAGVNQIHFQYGRDLETAGANASGPSVATGIDTFGMPNALPRIAEPDEHRLQFTDVYSFTHGHHTFKFGGDYNNVHEVMINLFQGGGVYGYSGSTNNLNFQSYVQDAFAGQPGDTDPYAGYHYTSFVQTVDLINTAAGTQGKDDFHMNIFDGFAEDTWKITPTFTLTAGVRYDIQITPSPQFTTPPVATFINPLNYGNPFPKYSSTIKNVNRVQPRVGFSWQVQPGTVVRGGYGVFSALNQGSTYYADRVENGVVQVNINYSGCGATKTATTTVSCNSVPGTGTQAATLRFPNVPFPVSGPSLANALYPNGGTAPSVNTPATQSVQSFHGLDPNFAPPYAHEADLSVEQQLPGKMSLSVGYVGTRGMRLPVFVDANLIGQTPHGLRTYNVEDANNNVIKQLTVPVYLSGNVAGTVSDRINPSLAAYNVGFSKANTWYNSLAATVRRPFANGLEVIANYTWEHASDTGQVQGSNGTFYGGDPALDPNNQKAENGLSDIDIRNRFTLSLVYQPHLFESNKLAKLLIDDWIFSGADIATAGQPIFLGMSGTVYSGATSSTSYGNDGNIYGGAISSGSSAATTGRPPQVGRNSIIGKGFNDFDFRASRNFPIHDKIYLQFSADAFNLLNHTIVTSQVGTLSAYLNVNGTSQGTVLATCTATGVPAGSTLQGCIVPNTSLTTGTVAQGLASFGATNGTNNGLYSARQMQFSAKLFF